MGLVLVSTSSCSTLLAAEVDQPLVIGVDLALDGQHSQLDSVYQHALDLRAEQLNTQRERAGLAPVELRVLDNQSDSATSLANIEELVGDDEVTAIITGGCGECIVAAAEPIEAAQKTTITLAAATAATEPVTDRRHIFKVAPDAAGSADVIAAELARAGVENLAVLVSDDLYGADGAREMTDAAVPHDLDVVLLETVANTDEAVAEATRQVAEWTDPPPEADPLAPAPPPQEPATVDAVLLWLPELLANQAAVSLREAGWQGQLWLDALAAGPLVVGGEIGQALDGARLIFTDTIVMDTVVATLPHQTVRKAWWDHYLSRHGNYQAHSSFAADALEVLVTAWDRAGGDHTTLRAHVESTQLAGVTATLRFSPGNHSGLSSQTLTVLVFVGDRWQITG